MTEAHEALIVNMLVPLGVAVAAYLRARVADLKSNSNAGRLDGLENGKGRRLMDKNLAKHGLIDAGAITQHGDEEEP
jgi:hypothetical protein